MLWPCIEKFSTIYPTTTLKGLPGYVDLGMAYERASDPADAHESFIQVGKQLDSDNPAAYMQEAILDARLHKVDEANRAFSKAETIFPARLTKKVGRSWIMRGDMRRIKRERPRKRMSSLTDR